MHVFNDLGLYEPRYENRLFAYAKTKMQIICAVTAQLISAFVIAMRIVQSLYYLNPKFQASSYLLWLYSPICVEPGQKPRRPVFSQRGSYGCLYGPAALVLSAVVIRRMIVKIFFVYLFSD